MSERLGPHVTEEAFLALLAARADAVVVAVGDDGLIVPFPASLDVSSHRIAVARSGLDLVAPSSTMAVINAWEEVRAEGAASTPAELEGGGRADVLFFDLTERHGIYAAAMITNDDAGLPDAAVAPPPLPPRLARVRKDAAAHIVEVDDAAVAMFGFVREELVGRRSVDLIHPDDHAAVIAAWMDVVASPGATRRVRARHLRADGSWLWVEIGNRNLLADPAVGAVDSDVLDITEEMAVLDELRQREELLARMAGALPIGVVHFDVGGRILYANARLYELIGLPEDADEAAVLACVVDAEGFDAALAQVRAGIDTDQELLLDRADGEGRRHCTIAFRALSDSSGRPNGGVACITDVTDSMRMRSELETRATYDVLTGCVNRATVLAALEQRLAAPAGGLAAVFVDLDRFKAINDGMGHSTGDTVLVAAAARLREGVRGGDVIGRLGGDEFLAVCAEVPDEATAVQVGERIAAALNGPLEVGGHRIELRASVGVAWVDPGTTPTDAEAVIARADGAMYASKRQADGRPVMAAMGATEAEMVRTITVVDRAEALRRGIDAGELEVHFQPVLEAAGALIGFEALLRWRREDRLVPAAEFIEAAEATGLICEVGPWVVDEVCRQAVASRRTDLTWFVNLSPRELAAPRTIGAVHRALDRHGLPPSSLVVELTEHAALADGGMASSVVSELVALGVGTAIDDFGSGWSSLISLLEVPARWIKIDRRFTAAVGTPTGGAIVAGVIDLAHRLGMRSIAEGVETEAELAVLRSLGIDGVQGHLLGRPEPLGGVRLPVSR